MKKLISLGILSLSLIACGEQLQSYYVGNARITDHSGCSYSNNEGSEVSLKVRARISGSSADFKVISVSAIQTDSGISYDAKNAFEKFFVTRQPAFEAIIIDETYFEEKPNQPIREFLFSEGLTEEDVEREGIKISGEVSASRDQIQNLEVEKAEWTRNKTTGDLEFCSKTFRAPLLIKQ